MNIYLYMYMMYKRTLYGSGLNLAPTTAAVIRALVSSTLRPRDPLTVGRLQRRKFTVFLPTLFCWHQSPPATAFSED